MRLPERRSDSSALIVNKKKDKKNTDKSDKKTRKERAAKVLQVPQREAFLCERDNKQDDQWLADSGASAHMTNNKSFFLSYELFNYPREVQVGNNETIHAYGEGTINVQMRLNGLWQQNHLKNVCANQNGCTFKKDGRGKRTTKGLLVLDMQVCLHEIVTEVHTASSKENLQLWHEQFLAHVPKEKRRKWDKKSVAGKLVGYCDEKDGYRIWIEAEGNVIRSRDVVFKKEMPLKEKLQLLFSKKQKDVDSTSHQTEIDVNDEPSNEGENDIEVTTLEEAVVEDGIPTLST
ncbi:hypothetical protein QE152_g39080 [Popillia japonica]|uniref:Uncharacterized protein n=1 Tax=Popillia japonica TaxID=7064 RepID=A0AAW1HVA5_POPJA